MKPALGISAASLLVVWVLCAVVYGARSQTGTYNWGALRPIVICAALLTVAAAALQTLAWRRGVGPVAALLTTLAAGMSVSGLLVTLSLAGG